MSRYLSIYVALVHFGLRLENTKSIIDYLFAGELTVFYWPGPISEQDPDRLLQNWSFSDHAKFMYAVQLLGHLLQIAGIFYGCFPGYKKDDQWPFEVRPWRPPLWTQHVLEVGFRILFGIQYALLLLRYFANFVGADWLLEHFYGAAFAWYILCITVWLWAACIG